VADALHYGNFLLDRLQVEARVAPRYALDGHRLIGPVIMVADARLCKRALAEYFAERVPGDWHPAPLGAHRFFNL